MIEEMESTFNVPVNTTKTQIPENFNVHLEEDISAESQSDAIYAASFPLL